MSLVFVDLDRSGKWFCFQTSYDPDFVEAFKVRVPAPNRRWRPEERVWCVTRQFWAVTEKLLRKHYGPDARFEVGPAAEAAQIELMVEEVVVEPSAMEYMKLGIRADAPDCVIHAAYTALEAARDIFSPVEIAQMGIYPIAQTREAYERVCAIRNIEPTQPMQKKETLVPNDNTDRDRDLLYDDADDNDDTDDNDDDGYDRADERDW